MYYKVAFLYSLYWKTNHYQNFNKSSACNNLNFTIMICNDTAYSPRCIKVQCSFPNFTILFQFQENVNISSTHVLLFRICIISTEILHPYFRPYLTDSRMNKVFVNELLVKFIISNSSMWCNWLRNHKYNQDSDWSNHQ